MIIVNVLISPDWKAVTAEAHRATAEAHRAHLRALEAKAEEIAGLRQQLRQADTARATAEARLEASEAARATAEAARATAEAARATAEAARARAEAELAAAKVEINRRWLAECNLQLALQSLREPLLETNVRKSYTVFSFLILVIFSNSEWCVKWWGLSNSNRSNSISTEVRTIGNVHKS